jgi:hypothetical protein
MYRVRGYIFLAVSFSTALFVARLLYTHIFTICQHTLIFDPLFSSEMQEEIRVFIEKKIVSPEALCMALKNQFPTIKDIVCQHKQYKKIVLTMHACKPLFLLNDSQVLLENGIVEKKFWFSDESLQSLYNITNKVAELRSRCHDASIHWLEENSDSVFEYFKVELIDPTTIVLSDKQAVDFQVFCNEQTKVSQEIFKTCFSLKDELKKTVPQKKGQQQSWIADLRFNNQIILYRKRGMV